MKKSKIKLYNLLYEELTRKQKEELERLYQTWKETLPDLSLELAEKIYIKHREVYGRVKENHPAVIRFLLKYNGKFKRPKYTIDDLKNINQPLVRIDHLIDFLQDFIKEELMPKDTKANIGAADKERRNQIFAENGNEATVDKIEESENMWRSDENAIVNKNGTRVYEIMNQSHIIRMGYYYQFMSAISATKTNTPMLAWCVTHRGDGVVQYEINEYGERIGNRRLYTHGANQYNGYRRRDNSSTFYFVIDENKPEEDKYYFGAILVRKDGSILLASQYQNDGGERYLSWNDLVKIYPNIAEFKDKFKFRKDDVEEQGVENIETIVDIINENINSPHYYGRQTPELQREYIENGGMLTLPTSWQATDFDDRKTYINLTEQGTLFARFNNIAFIEEIIKRTDEKNYLNRKITFIGFPEGLAYLYKQILKTKYTSYGTNKKNHNQKLLRHKDTNKFGIYDLSQNALSWVNFEGIKYIPEYNKKTGGKLYYVPNSPNAGNTRYIIEIYYKTNEDDNSTFYTVTNEKIQGKIKEMYILTKKAMDEIKEKYNFNPQTNTFQDKAEFDSDINEIY